MTHIIVALRMASWWLCRRPSEWPAAFIRCYKASKAIDLISKEDLE